MADLHEAALGRNAKTSRRGGVRSGGSRMKGRESWHRLFQRGRRNLRSAEGFLGMARQIIERCETIAMEHPIKAVHDMYRVTGLLVEAADRLARLGKCIRETYDRIAEAPGYAGDAPERMIADLQSWIETGTKLALLGNRFDKSFAELIEYAQSGNAPLDMSELLKKRVHPVPVLPGIRRRRSCRSRTIAFSAFMSGVSGPLAWPSPKLQHGSPGAVLLLSSRLARSDHCKLRLRTKGEAS